MADRSNDSGTRNRNVLVRVSEAELDLLDRMARDEARSRSSFLRNLLRRAGETAPPEVAA